MEPIAVTTQEGTLLIPRLTVQQIIDLTAEASEAERQAILRDLRDAEASASERMERLERHRRESSLSSTVIRDAFNLVGARRILSAALGSFPASLEDLDPARLSRLALGSLGVDLDEYAEGSAEGKADQEAEA